MAEAQMFLVRVWQSRGRFFATLRVPGGAGDALSFTDPLQVGEFLRWASDGLGPARDGLVQGKGDAVGPTGPAAVGPRRRR